MSYNRDDAVSYASTHWQTNCHDGVISIIGSPSIFTAAKKRELGLTPPSAWSVKLQPFTHPDARGALVTEQEAATFVGPGGATVMFQPWAGLGDCAHFLCRCLNAGGIGGLTTDYVPYMNSYLRNLSFTKTVGSEIPPDRVKRIVDKGVMKKGDVILYVAPPGGELGGGYVHSAIFVTPSTISCHTTSRFNESWDAPHKDDGFSYTLIHFSHDDPVNHQDEKLSGWWEVTWRGESYFYFFEGGRGRVWYTQVRPTDRARPIMPTGSGYYFPRLTSTFLICWSGTGTVEEFTIGADEQSLTGTWNGWTRSQVGRCRSQDRAERLAKLQTRSNHSEDRTALCR